jgi:hypothetical protein
MDELLLLESQEVALISAETIQLSIGRQYSKEYDFYINL